MLNRIPVCPSIGNHDTRETEEHDDREQVMDNMYLRERLAGEEAAGRASVEPGLFYRFRASADIEFVCIDTSKEDFFRRGRLFEYPKHWDFLEKAFPAARGGPREVADPVRASSALLRRAAASQHARDGEAVELFQRSGVRAHFSGHEHNFQHSRVDGIDYFVSGAGAKIRRAAPDGFAAAHTLIMVGGVPLPAGDDRRRSHDRSRDRREPRRHAPRHRPSHALRRSRPGSDRRRCRTVTLQSTPSMSIYYVPIYGRVG